MIEVSFFFFIKLIVYQYKSIILRITIKFITITSHNESMNWDNIHDFSPEMQHFRLMLIVLLKSGLYSKY